MDAREYILNQGFDTEKIDTPWWPEWDGKLAVRELSGIENQELLKDPSNPMVIGKTLVAVLLNADTKQPVFLPTDFQFLMSTVGVSKLTPVLDKVGELSKKKSVTPLPNSNQTSTNDSSSN